MVNGSVVPYIHSLLRQIYMLHRHLSVVFHALFLQIHLQSSLVYGILILYKPLCKPPSFHHLNNSTKARVILYESILQFRKLFSQFIVFIFLISDRFIFFKTLIPLIFNYLSLKFQFHFLSKENVTMSITKCLQRHQIIKFNPNSDLWSWICLALSNLFGKAYGSSMRVIDCRIPYSFAHEGLSHSGPSTTASCSSVI